LKAQACSVLLRECARRRADLAGMIGTGSIAVIPAATRKVRSNDVCYRFRQNSDFWYLTGFNEPDAVLVISSERGSDCQASLFCAPQDPQQARWHGDHAGIDAACEVYGMDAAYSLAKLDDIMPQLLYGRERVFSQLGQDAAFDQRLIGWMHLTLPQQGKMPDRLVDVSHLLHELRLQKSRYELQLMQSAADLSCRAHMRVMRQIKTLNNESEVHALLLHEYLRHDCEPAYPAIVGSGDNACILHYTDNNQPLQSDALLLIDSGCEYQGYAADISRTFPVNGRFSSAQKDLYEVVLTAQAAAIEQAHTANCWDAVHAAAARSICTGLCALGIVKESEENALETNIYEKYFMHKTGHWLGLDVHDVGDYRVNGESRQLEPGMVMTVEPGIYIAADDESVDKRWRGLGIRIEDDVVVTKDQPRVLSAALPRTVADLEAMINAG